MVLLIRMYCARSAVKRCADQSAKGFVCAGSTSVGENLSFFPNFADSLKIMSPVYSICDGFVRLFRNGCSSRIHWRRTGNRAGMNNKGSGGPPIPGTLQARSREEFDVGRISVIQLTFLRASL
jgi:hypothetical protein